MSCLHRILRGRGQKLREIATWNKIIGMRQCCNLKLCNQDGYCDEQEYYEQFEVSGVVVACCRRGDNHLLNVTKRFEDGTNIVEHRRVKLKDGGIAD